MTFMADSSPLPRHLFYVGDPLTLELRPHLDTRGWPGKAMEPNRESGNFSSKPSGGLLDFSARSVLANLRLAESWLSVKTVGWLALLSPAQLEDSTIRRLVRDFCFDYVTLPASGDRILNALGHAYGIAALHDSGVRDPANGKNNSHAEGDMIGSCDALPPPFPPIRKTAIPTPPSFASAKSRPANKRT